jgi:hypothetical protein
MEYTYPYTERQSGRTTFMIKELINSVLDGQPHSIVVGINYRQCTNLYIEIVNRLMLRDISIDHYIYPTKIIAGGSEILFFTKAEFEGDRCRGMSLSKYGIFEDHLAAGEY